MSSWCFVVVVKCWCKFRKMVVWSCCAVVVAELKFVEKKSGFAQEMRTRWLTASDAIVRASTNNTGRGWVL
jgi:hypothetical protein